MDIKIDRIDETIITIVLQRQRDLAVRGTGRGVFPRHVQPWLEVDEYRCEFTIRRRMNRLAAAGALERVGGERSRRGYVVYRYPPRTVFPRQLELPGF